MENMFGVLAVLVVAALALMPVAIVAIVFWYKARRRELEIQQSLKLREFEHQQRLKELELEIANSKRSNQGIAR